MRALAARCPALLFFGCRHPDQDYIYAKELKEQVDAGNVDLAVAFSRHDGKKTYVQDLLKEKADKVAPHIPKCCLICSRSAGEGMRGGDSVFEWSAHPPVLGFFGVDRYPYHP